MWPVGENLPARRVADRTSRASYTSRILLEVPTDDQGCASA